jgi:hypothetical protein
MMNTTMRKVFKILVWPVCIALAIGLFFADNIKGYYRFKELCATEAGLKVYQPLERDVGWFADGDIYSAIPMTSYDAVAFVRYHNTNEDKWYDVHRAKRLKVSDLDYTQQPADLSKPVVYQSRVINHHDLPNEVRMGAQVTEFIDLRVNQLVASYTILGYSKFNPQNTLLAAPSGIGCPEQGGGIDPKTGKQLPTHKRLAISSIFIQ